LFLPISRSRGPVLRSRQNPACLYRGHGGTEIRIRNPETQPGLLKGWQQITHFLLAFPFFAQR